jgi:tetratricopeptide (TPR) repeat protein
MNRSTLTCAPLLLTAFWLSATAPIAHAQPSQPKSTTQPTQQVLDEARKHFQSAEAAKARGEYQIAAVEYLAAYKVFDEPAFLYDTAEVYRLAGDEKNALAYYTKYLELAPSGQGAPAARVAADRLRRSIASKEEAAKSKAYAEAKRKADAEDAEAKRKADAEAKRAADAEARRAADDEAKRAADAEARRKANNKVASATGTVESVAVRSTRTDGAAGGGRGMRIAGLATGGVGALGLGIGVVFGLKARSLSNEASSWMTYDRKRDDQGRAYQRDMFVFTGIGAAALVGGGILYYLGHRAEQSTALGTLSFLPSIGPSEIAFTAAGHF